MLQRVLSLAAGQLNIVQDGSQGRSICCVTTSSRKGRSLAAVEGERVSIGLYTYFVKYLESSQPDDAELYDTVTDEQYRSIVGSRLDRDDFIEDDDGSGYVDNGVDDWEGGDNDDDSEDEDAFDGEDEALRLGQSQAYVCVSRTIC